MEIIFDEKFHLMSDQNQQMKLFEEKTSNDRLEDSNMLVKKAKEKVIFHKPEVKSNMTTQPKVVTLVLLSGTHLFNIRRKLQ